MYGEIIVKVKFKEPLTIFDFKVYYDNYRCDTLKDVVKLCAGFVVYDSLNDCEQLDFNKVEPFSIEGDNLLGYSFNPDGTIDIISEKFYYTYNPKYDRVSFILRNRKE